MSNTLSVVFMLANLILIPPYVVMIFFPRRTLSQNIMRSLWSVITPSLLTLIFGTIFIVIDKQALPAFLELMSASGGTSAFSLYYNMIVNLPPAALVMWLHAIAADLVMARWAYLDSLERQLPTRAVSLAIFLMLTNGPLGFILYFAIRKLTSKNSHNSET